MRLVFYRKNAKLPGDFQNWNLWRKANPNLINTGLVFSKKHIIKHSFLVVYFDQICLHEYHLNTNEASTFPTAYT